MIKPEEIKNQNFKIFLGMPMYGGMLSEATLHGLLELQSWTVANNVHLRIQTMGNESLITRARNTIVSMMMDQTDFIATHLLFIDADIGFTPQNIERLLCADKDVTCGIYPRKHLYLEKIKKILEQNPNAQTDEIEAKALGYNVNFDNPEMLQGENGFFKVNEAATGMMMVKREVFRTMFKKFPERKYESDQIVNGVSYRSDNCYDLFAVGPYKTLDQIRYLSEDYYFSRLWTEECNGEIWADLAMPLTHFGNRAFKGHVGTLVEPKK
jgi:glycosyltransferase involved in cell wall biosynthesis|tara:strand:- start:307 stop:1110 length:804 start_codon:yes stop_codon:yes gene_type:complete